MMPMLTLHRPRRHQGFTLIELMVAITIGMLVVASAVGVFANIKLTYVNQNTQVQMQDAQRQAVAMLTTTVQAAGYFVNPGLTTRSDALPASSTANADGTTFASGQIVSGTDGSTNDTLNVRFQTASGDGVFNCNGGTNSTGYAQVYINAFAVNTSNELTCSVNGGTAFPILSGVASMVVEYGLDRTDSDNDFTYNPRVDTYLNATNVASLGLWNRVLTVRVTLNFVNGNQSWVQVINLMNQV